MEATKLEWLETIKSPTGDHTNIRGLAIRRAFETEINNYEIMFTNNNYIIGTSINWAHTPEGFGFWRNIHTFNRDN